jgi:UDP-glucose 4-epimerase
MRTGDMKALVTGGAGCIGSELSAALLARGWDVLVLDNLSSGTVQHLDPILKNPGFHLVEGDLLDRNVVERAVQGVDIVYHLAANPDVKYAHGDTTDKDLQQNTLATYYLLEAMRLAGAMRIAFTSTSAVYGISPMQPIPESCAPRPISLYGASKLSCEALISAFSNLFGIQAWIFRLANIVGAKVRKTGRTAISDFIHRLTIDPKRLQILGNGRQAKSYLLVDECVDAILFVIEHAQQPLNVFNVGGSDSVPVARIAEIVAQQLGLIEVEYSYTGGEGGWPGDVPRFVLDVSALDRLGWRARHSSEEAVSIAAREAVRYAALGRGGV